MIVIAEIYNMQVQVARELVPVSFLRVVAAKFYICIMSHAFAKQNQTEN